MQRFRRRLCAENKGGLNQLDDFVLHVQQDDQGLQPAGGHALGVEICPSAKAPFNMDAAA